ncbi:exodeoxyribonuclease VII large subunit [Actinobaculum suis]|uniref:Exodeoxyribonuclease 7 large subunit n=1 Tax=Actinobaculum suis TaxID=1657 RepID=A0A0K9EVD1_9ACTO|nr:exodeoxyribonuclease VII large subunit [Actinobaculum suis]KMY23865.1 exodeoxyribonuclease VII large subunit [Actinobaculum suis]MDY5153580.1 exodeoxyribonuclease VII large subunit [Actinobaculum suis]SDE24700.1 exodeoxyribonuclease VII large subunit [Actinobaculum suis]VDG75868.1 exodeoxyribonuclease VII, large subunit [Actinobaculum suis]
MASKIPVPAHLPQRAAQTSPEHPWPVRLLAVKIREYVAAMSGLWVEGEVITLQRRPGARVQFLTLRDLEENYSMTVKIMTHLLPLGVQPGSRVVVWAKPDYYAVNGSLALWAKEIRPVGVGDILARIEALKNRLAAEGLFDSRRKKPLPFLPRAIGLIVGRNTKAKEDVMVNASIRWPGVTFEVREVQVQGQGAVEAMIPALRELDALPQVEVIVLARGGGSVEDLLPFSDERLVREIAATHTPTVSAIGHEGDNPLSDLAADFRASTPTDAAKHIVPDVREEQAGITEARARIRRAVQHRLSRAQQELDAVRGRPVLARPQTMVEMRQTDLTGLRDWLRSHTKRYLAAGASDVSNLLVQLRALSPRATLDRGYAILLRDSGEVVKSTEQVSTGDMLSAVLAHGRLNLNVKGGA